MTTSTIDFNGRKLIEFEIGIVICLVLIALVEEKYVNDGTVSEIPLVVHS